MKTKTLKLTALLLIIAGVFTACNGKEQPVEPFLNIDTPTITATAEGGVFYISVNSNGEWTVVVQDAENNQWFTLTNVSGTNDGVITVDIAENILFETRSTTIKISMGSLTETVVVEQQIEGYVPFKLCLCNEEMPLWDIQRFPRGEAFLFRDSIPLQMRIEINHKANSAPFPKVCWIIHCSKTDVASIRITNLYYPEGGRILSVGTICNFPDFTKEWDIPKNGIRVIIEGVMYGACNPHGTQDVIPFDYVLTSLKRKRI